MARLTIPVTVSPALKGRVQALAEKVRSLVTPTAGRAVDQSSISRLAIEDLLDRYEKNPTDLANRLGLNPRSAGEA